MGKVLKSWTKKSAKKYVDAKGHLMNGGWGSRGPQGKEKLILKGGKAVKAQTIVDDAGAFFKTKFARHAGYEWSVKVYHDLKQAKLNERFFSSLLTQIAGDAKMEELDDEEDCLDFSSSDEEPEDAE